MASELAAILPDLSQESIKGLLLRANGDAHKALNLFLDEGLAPQSKACPVQPATATQKENTSANLGKVSGAGGVCSEDAPRIVNGWPKLLGEMGVVGYTVRDVSPSMLPTGTKIQLSHSVPDAKKGKGQEKGRGGFHAKKAKAGEGIVRWSASCLQDCGRLPADLSKALFSLLSNGSVQVVCKVVAPPDSSSKFANVWLSLMVWAGKAALSPTAFPASLSQSTHTETQSAFIRLLSLISVCPAIQTAATCDELSLQNDSAQSSTGKHSADVCGAAESKRAKVAEGQPVVPAAQEVEGANKHSITDEDIETVLNRMEQKDLPLATPSQAMRSSLRSYQLQALHWMLEREECRVDQDSPLHPLWAQYKFRDGTPFYVKPMSNLVSLLRPQPTQTPRGGILADAMGLGKTVEMLALIALDKTYQPSVHSSGKSNFVDLIDDNPPPPSHSHIAPSSLSQEATGLQSHPEEDVGVAARGSIHAFLGKTTAWTKKLHKGGTLIVCPMSLLGQWEDEAAWHIKEGHLRVHVHYGGDRTASAVSLGQWDVVLTSYGVLSADHQSPEKGPLYRVHWHRVVLDEAHSIKSRTTQTAIAATDLTATCRWAMTGTPLQNSLDDIYSLLRFLRLEPWDDRSYFTKRILKPFEEQRDMKIFKQVRNMLNPIILRRDKSSTYKDGTPILTLPPKVEELVELDLSEEERTFYDATFKNSKGKFDGFVASGNVLKNFASILEMLLRLRQICNHPVLAMPKEDSMVDKDDNVHSDDGPALRLRPLEDGLRGLDGSSLDIECSICLDTVEDGLITPCQHVFCRECITSALRRMIDSVCPFCRSPVDGSDLFKKPAPAPTVWNESCSSTKINALIRELKSLRIVSAVAQNSSVEGSRDVHTSRVEPLSHESVCEDVEMCDNECTSSSEDHSVHGAGSAKRSTGQKHADGNGMDVPAVRTPKSVVFSQWTGMLDLVQRALQKEGFKVVRLDGSMTQTQRSESIAAFAEQEKIEVMLISTRAGGVGINLTCASTVFLLDLWWNPSVDDQAIARVHRLGQTKAVSVKKLIVRNSIEERILVLQERKRNMVNGAIGGAGVSKEQSQALRVSDLRELFESFPDRQKTSG